MLDVEVTPIAGIDLEGMPRCDLHWLRPTGEVVSRCKNPAAVRVKFNCACGYFVACFYCNPCYDYWIKTRRILCRKCGSPDGVRFTEI